MSKSSQLNGTFKTGNGESGTLPWLFLAAHWHLGKEADKYLMSLLMPGQGKCFLIRAVVFLTPRCPALGLE